VLIQGYIDESYNADVFTLSCLVSRIKTWTELSSAWKKCLQRWNDKLEATGRPPVSRYHAKDCGNLKREFSGWNTDEQVELTKDLLLIFKRHPLVNMSMSLNRRDLNEVFPEFKQKSVQEALAQTYGLVTKFLLFQMGREIGGRNRFVLIYDRGPYASDMVKAFNQVISDGGFQHRECFLSFTPMDSFLCIPLQVADLIAYENFKETSRRFSPRNRRKTLALLLDLGSFGGRARYIDRDALLALKEVLKRSKK
jgi:hypothetical protein